jgi:hypothetical protein
MSRVVKPVISSTTVRWRGSAFAWVMSSASPDWKTARSALVPRDRGADEAFRAFLDPVAEDELFLLGVGEEDACQNGHRIVIAVKTVGREGPVGGCSVRRKIVNE